MIAIAVSAIVIVTVSTALSRISRTRDVARTRLEAVTRANAALDAIRRDIASVVRDGDLFYTRVLLKDSTSFTQYGQLDQDQVLVYNNRLRPMNRDEYAGEGGEYESQYRIEDDQGGSVLWMRRDAVPDENGEGGGMAIPVVEGIVGVQVEAYDGESWYPDWDSDLFGLPWALRVTVTATGESADNPSADPMRSTVALRTQIPIERIVPPPPPPEENEDGTNPDGSSTDPSADPNADGQKLPQDGGIPVGPGGPGGGRPGDGMGPGGPGGGGPGIRPGGGRKPTFSGGGMNGGTILNGGRGGGRGGMMGTGIRGSYSTSNRGP